MNIYIMGEDAPERSLAILQNIIIRSIYLIEPNFHKESDELSINGSDFFSLTLQGNLWKTKKPTSNFDELCKFIADVYENEEDFIFWHIDADLTWIENQTPHSTKNIKQLEEIVLKKVQQFHSGGKGKKKEFKIENLYQKLILMIPYYSIESWLYENYEIVKDSHKHFYEELKELKSKHGNNFDNIKQIKESTNVKAKINPELSERFPSGKVNSIDMSYAFFIKHLNENTFFKSKIPTRC